MDAFDNDPKIKRLRSMAAFSGETTSELGTLTTLCTEVRVKDGHVLARQNSTGQEAFVILEGAAAIVQDGKEIAVVGPGEWIGEMSLVSHTVRNADVIARGDATLFVFNPREFDDALESIPVLAAKVRKTVAERSAK